jgi:hypothetical protein
MGSVHERRSVEVPINRAPEYVGRYINDVATAGLGRIVLSVKIPLERLGFDRCIEVSKAVSVSFTPSSARSCLNPLTAISWHPDGNGPLPDFSGTVGVEPDAGDGSCCSLTLDGEYDPPLGLIGDAFDALVGRHIARQTARTLLDEMAIMMETAHGNG